MVTPESAEHDPELATLSRTRRMVMVGVTEGPMLRTGKARLRDPSM